MEDIYLPKSKFANEIAGLCFAAYDRLGKAGKPVANKEWTLLSGILYEKSGHLELVSLATGTKCIGAKSMRPDGTIVNDSHAEVSSSIYINNSVPLKNDKYLVQYDLY